jgi:alanine dehydrogenase
MPGAVPHTSTYALTNATLPYQIDVASFGAKGSIEKNPALLHGLNTHAGMVTYEAVARELGVPFTPAREALAS